MPGLRPCIILGIGWVNFRVPWFSTPRQVGYQWTIAGALSTGVCLAFNITGTWRLAIWIFESGSTERPIRLWKVEWRDITRAENCVYRVSLVKLLDDHPLTKIDNLSTNSLSWCDISVTTTSIRLKDVDYVITTVESVIRNIFNQIWSTFYECKIIHHFNQIWNTFYECNIIHEYI